jgi:hypothetical protein
VAERSLLHGPDAGAFAIIGVLDDFVLDVVEEVAGTCGLLTGADLGADSDEEGVFLSLVSMLSKINYRW